MQGNGRILAVAAIASLAGLAACSGGGDDSPPAATYAIRGNVSGASSVTVNLAGAASSSTTTDASGNYSFTGLANGAYLVTPSKAGYTFSPTSRSITVNGADQNGQDFAASPVTYSISGNVSGASSVTMNLTGAATATVTTDGSGNYSFAGLSNGSYVVTPTKAGYSFNPVSASVTVSGANVTGRNFTATPVGATYAISGTVSGAVTAGVTINLSGDATGSTTTGAGGTYSFAGLVNGSYTVTPSLAGYTFSPASRSPVVSGGDVTGQDFVASAVTYSISGNVSGAASVTVNLTGTSNAVTTTDGSGNYSFTGLSNGSYTVTPSKIGYAFTPASRPVTVSGANVTGQNFTAALMTYTISGNISGASAVRVDLTGAAVATTTTDGSGNYSFTGLSNGTYTVTPSKSGYAFTPTSQEVTINYANATGKNFTASAASTYTISGTISGPWVRYVTIALGGAASRTTSTDVNGQYIFTGLSNGTYTVTPSLDGYSYTPASPTVTISGADRFQDFTAIPDYVSYSISGAVSYGGSRTGRVTILAYSDTCGSCSPYGGTSISGPGSYTIRGLPPGGYTLQARMDVMGHGARNASDPYGSGGATISAMNVTGANIALSDPPTPIPQPIPFVAAFPGSGTVVLFWDAPYYGSAEAATSYQVSWGTDTNASNGGIIAVDARDDAHYIHGGLLDGSLLYYKIRGLVDTTPGTWSTPVSATVGAVPGGYTVSGTVSFTGAATGPLYVGLMDEVNMVMRVARYASPSSPVSFSVTGVSAGQHFLFAIVDQDNDGIVDEGDISNTQGDSNGIYVSGNVSGQSIVLPAENALATTRTEHTLTAYMSEWYMLGNRVNRAVKRPVSVTLFSGNGIAVPADLGNEWEFAHWASLGMTPPTVGDVYSFEVLYSDGTSEVLTSVVTAVLSSFPESLAANSAPPYSPGEPMFTWQPPTSPPVGTYGYTVSVWGNGANWWYPNSNVPLPSTTLQALYNEDGNAWPPTLGPGTYTWGVSVVDANRNSARREATYVVY